MSPRPDVSEHRKSQILSAAQAVFARQGFQNARMDDIVAESGLSKGTLYWYFKSKDEIILGIVDSMLDRELEHLRALEGEDAPASNRLVEFINLTISDFLALEGLFPILFEILALASRRNTVLRMIRHYFKSYLKVLETIIQQGLDAGEFRAIDPRDSAIALGAILEGMVLLKYYDPEAIDLEHHIRGAANLVLKGLHA